MFSAAKTTSENINVVAEIVGGVIQKKIPQTAQQKINSISIVLLQYHSNDILLTKSFIRDFENKLISPIGSPNHNMAALNTSRAEYLKVRVVGPFSFITSGHHLGNCTHSVHSDVHLHTRSPPPVYTAFIVVTASEDLNP